jgi:glycine/D-amino acid oxidase-like deaminating enzyme
MSIIAQTEGLLMAKSFLAVFFILLSFLVTQPVLAEQRAEQPAAEVRKITPPKLDAAHLGERITAYRPMRHGSPELTVEKRGEQIIANDYGHGGSGWSLAPGSASYVNQLLINSLYSADLKKDTPITIIGAGVIGLFTAYDLVQKGYTNITVVAENFDNLTSHNAGGLLAPASMDNEPKMQKIVDNIGIDGYKFFEQVAKKTHPDFKEGAAIMPLYCENRKDCGLEPFVGKVMSPAKEVTLDFGNGTKRAMIAYDDAIFVDTSLMMQSLHDYLKPRVKFVQKKVNDFKEIETKYIINCAGLGGGLLNHDKAVVPVQGHLVMLKDQNPEEMHYSILVYFDKKDKTKTGQTVKRSFYLIPKHLPNTGPNDVGVIGGTYIEGATSATPNSEQFDKMIEDAKKFYGC